MTDYEHIAAQAWKNWRDTNQGIESRTQRRLRRISVPKSEDNEATLQWRTHEPAKASINLPRHLLVRDKRPIKRQQRDSSHILFEQFPVLSSISARTGTHVGLNSGQIGEGGLKLYLWGSDEDVERAKALIKSWIAEETSLRRRGSKWPKESSLTEEQKETLQREYEKYLIAQEFRKSPPETFVPAKKCVFQWPIEDVGEPDQFLGRNFEALDPIRTEEFCYVTYHRSKSELIALAEYEERADKALERLCHLYRQLLAWRVPAKEIYLVLPPGADGQDQWDRVKLEDVPSDQQHGSAANKHPKKFPIGIAPLVAGIGSVDNEVIAMAKHENINDLRSALKEILPALPYYRGNLKMRVRLGGFLVTRYLANKEEYTWEEFTDTMKTGGRGETTEIYAKLPPIMTTPEVRTYASAILKILAGSSDDVPQPSHGVSFILQKANDRFCVECEYRGESEHESCCISQRWYKIDPETCEPFHLLDASLINVSKNSAWHLEITSGLPVGYKIAASLEKFANGVRLHYSLKNDSQGDFPTFSWGRVPELAMVQCQQRSIWRLRLEETDNMIELEAKRDLQISTEIAGRPQVNCTNDWKMTIAVVADRWARNIEQNAHLGIGRKANWKANIGSFFPFPKAEHNSSSLPDGIDDFVQYLSTVEDLIRNA